jgi:uncharacterized phage protein (TIGR01671 family)
MREIKFRFWDLQKKIWRNPMDFDLQSNGEIGFFNHRIVLQQYTGLDDKDGQKIYEGDILKCPWTHGLKNFSIAEVVFWEGAFYLSKGEATEYPEFCPYDLYDFNETLSRRCLWHRGEVIGNIFENKELLK